MKPVAFMFLVFLVSMVLAPTIPHTLIAASDGSTYLDILDVCGTGALSLAEIDESPCVIPATYTVAAAISVSFTHPALLILSELILPSSIEPPPGHSPCSPVFLQV